MDHDNPDDRTIHLDDLTVKEREFTQRFVDHLIAEITASFRQHQITAELSIAVLDNGFDISVVCKADVYQHACDLAQAVYDNVMRKIAEAPTN